ncbi:MULTISPECIES: hypothetical protein [Moorena]|uniref:Uncharacterized protein n=1 Tax=Moorena producens 3L TaxID=489825 RepID=F4XQ48_9CYAN|nr:MULTISPECIES: hypothetical protein [Moorena]EGJ33277.1 hypothetical protein LYNGBM3L_37630 [Moorena producens 3L]NEP31857.1 hypothetical protein [Moorena sp. SIO3B2]NEP66611.1 hypothetical protein [Moorena sp. SIO3A5]NEQ09728.1 hypothetical protein [Moorena sp. SIO4E2]NER90620.1 hypothetical protein [Moorena sp. SIO3A2]
MSDCIKTKKDNKQWIWLAIGRWPRYANDGRWPRYANKKLKKLLDFILEIVVENQQSRMFV